VSTVLFFFPFLLIYTVFAIYAERKISAFIQDRLGPMETGPYGLAQSVADLLKLIQKEDIVPSVAQKQLFRLAPLLIFVAVFAGFSVLPITPSWNGSGVASGVFLLLALVSLDVIGIIMAGWSSNNKYSTLGAFRSAAQIISYEVPLGLSVLCVCMYCESLDLYEISIQQSGNGFLSWNVFKMPLLFLAWIIFFIASLAESNRAPFDLPEAESELVAGFHTEYSGFRWAIIMLAEYGMMLLVSILGAIMFFGGWNTPFPDLGPVLLGQWSSGSSGSVSETVWALVWIVMKTLTFVGIQMWVRWTYPRLRIDQLMSVSWKYLTPAALALIILCGFWKIILVS
jgi:NADH-quinone oxidoreductase subunit H